ncbi:DUF4870 domain-containing protein [Leifsonia shinshuensis]|uniref:DUF4870 domain-containing protein n=1 Tax=Leifsonia shinshuensis TaxID=150026 RepID=UPI001F50F951|nr:DUF4870 domain-containing protein [Leifsonia shinshuensis]MCI0155494.1 DUF4870 domain-containing protein [Leifsonia shinshuensis]
MTDPTQPPADGDNGVPPQQPYSAPSGQPTGQPTGQPAGQPAGAVPPQQAYASAPAAPLDPAQDKQWASFAHLGGILWFLPSLIIWLVFKDRGALTNQEAKEALNWQITWIIAWAVSQILGVIIGSFTLGIGFLLFSLLIPWALYIVNLVFSILGFVKVNSGGSYRYPINFRFIK